MASHLEQRPIVHCTRAGERLSCQSGVVEDIAKSHVQVRVWKSTHDTCVVVADSSGYIADLWSNKLCPAPIHLCKHSLNVQGHVGYRGHRNPDEFVDCPI